MNKNNKNNKNNILTVEFTKDFIAKFLPEDPVIIEAGAHIGRDTVKMCKFWSKSKIYAFEPVPELYQKLILNTKSCDNISCYNLALSNKSGTAKMYVSSGRSTALSSLFEPIGGLTTHLETKFEIKEVKVTTLDIWAIKNNISRIDFIWLDAQGGELDILKGGENIIKTAKAIFIEASLITRYRNTPLYNELKSWINSQGFKAIAQDEPKHQKVNILFIKN